MTKPSTARRQPAPLFEPLEDLAALKAKALTVHHTLCGVYGCPVPFFSESDPLSSLVSNLLSHRTKNADTARALSSLRAAFPTWEAVRDAPVTDIQHAIRASTWPEQKAPRLQAVLHEVSERRGALNLDFLGELGVPQARAWLESIPGVGPKTSAATLLFSRLRMPAMPVDSHHHRVALRLELIPSGTAVGPSHALLERLLPEGWDAQQVYDHHEVLMMHGQQCCFFANPACGRCAVLGQCPTGQARLGQVGETANPVQD
ncbi:endonuclease III domain-containing protein [Deinococcus alpinitundrae]|uniref:endonuclease III domain-containing protein n=1 Tax=Deinococcus alpinitundrae TaxID=468913 RepID=UPI00137B660A|nr:Fe-S cluster assembly protein HesB [Deinococcus alpinitundrae]